MAGENVILLHKTYHKEYNAGASRSELMIRLSVRWLFYVAYTLGHVESQPAFTCSKLTIETLERGVKYVQS